MRCLATSTALGAAWLVACGSEPTATTPIPGEQADSNAGPVGDGAGAMDPDAAERAADVVSTDPGSVTMHRLNNTEYNNTVRDLLGTTSRPADAFPPDNSGGGYDNLASVLSLSASHLSALSGAAEFLVSEALGNPAQRAALVPCDLAAEGGACARDVVSAFAPRAWRRPVSADELVPLHEAIDEALLAGDTPEQALSIALEAILLSPHFLFRIELDSGSTEPHALEPHELASRVSYFLWSTMPDDALAATAASGALGGDGLRAEVDRMLGDDRARELVSNFAGQWLYLRQVDEVEPDATFFPDFDDDLRAAFKRESELLFMDVLFDGLPATALLTADYTYLNDRLASHYGLPPVGSDDFVRVDLTGNRERPGGILSHGSVLTVTSHASRTSPVLRGKWVLGQLVCGVIPPPPFDVNTNLPEMPAMGLTLREQQELHRSDPVCSTCHSLMDPIGFGLENYDPVGAYRTEDNGSPIDSSGEVNGIPFSGPAELREIVAGDEGFPECVIENLYTYALGRVPNFESAYMDGAVLDGLTERFRQDFDFRALIHDIVQSETFVTRQASTAAAPTPAASEEEL